MKHIDGEFDKDIARELERKLDVPESLSEKNIVKLLKEKKISPKKVVSLSFIPKTVAAAAVLVLVTVMALYISLDSELITVEYEGSMQETSSGRLTEGKALSLKKAKSEDDLINLFVKDYAEGRLGGITHSIKYYGSKYNADDMAVMDNMAPTSAAAAPAAPTASPEGAGSVEYADTNVQVEGVDEGDIIKNDGRYIYSVTGYYDVNGKSTSLLTVTDTEKMEKIYQDTVKLETKNKDMDTVYDIYVREDTLIAICSYDNTTYIVVYDITDRKNPTEIRTVSQDGSYRSSRMTGSVIYTVTNHYVWSESLKGIREEAIPRIDGKYMPYDMCYIADERSKTYTVLTAFDTDKTGSDVSSVSVLGGADEVYCSTDTLYVYGYSYDSEDMSESTVLYSFSLDGTELKQKAAGRVRGTVVNQYSLDEYKGYLRIATTYYDYKHNADVSGVYVLDEKLSVVGKVTDIAHDEQVKSVRFMGDTGYVVTFRNTDPLFIIDFSEAERPVVTGELKLPGYSAYLHPLDEKYLIGIGYNGDEESADMNSVKISVFDVSDKSKPVLTDSMVIEKTYSLVNTNPKAFLYYRSKDTVFIPVTHSRNGMKVKSLQSVRVSDGKIREDYGFVHGVQDYSGEGYYGAFYMYDEFFRGTYIGEHLYTLDNYRIVEHNLENGEKERECEIYEKKKSDNKQIVTQAPVLYGEENVTSYVLID